MQNRLKNKFSLYVQRIDLPKEFPIYCEPSQRFNDSPVKQLHVHNIFEVGLCNRGSGIFIAGTKIMPFKQGDVTIVNSQEMHRAQSGKGVISDFAWIVVDVYSLLLPYFNNPAVADVGPFCGPSFRNVLNRERHGRVFQLVGDIIRAFNTHGPNHRDIVRALFVLLMDELHGLPGLSKRSVPDPNAGDYERISPALEQIHTNFSDDLTVAALAQICCMSVSNFRFIFTRLMHKGPQRYLLQLRIAMAQAELKATTKPISRIAFDNGFLSISCFSRAFRNFAGMTPRQWRRGANIGRFG
jgi:AraC family transcriptional regulator, activator of mtrCDE